MLHATEILKLCCKFFIKLLKLLHKKQHVRCYNNHKTKTFSLMLLFIDWFCVDEVVFLGNFTFNKCG